MEPLLNNGRNLLTFNLSTEVNENRKNARQLLKRKRTFAIFFMLQFAQRVKLAQSRVRFASLSLSVAFVCESNFSPLFHGSARFRFNSVLAERRQRAAQRHQQHKQQSVTN